MTFSSNRLRWMAVLGGLACFSLGNAAAAQEKVARQDVNPIDEPMAAAVTAATFGDVCAPPGNDTPPPCDEVVNSLGQFKIQVSPRFFKNMDGCPGYDPVTHILTSPILFDPNTVIGRSAPHLEDDASDLGGTPVGKAGTVISDAMMVLHPGEAPPGTREVHTEVFGLFLTDGAGANVRAGVHAADKPLSPGEVQSLSGPSGDPKQDFKAYSFFNMYVDVDIPACGGFPGGTLTNIIPLLIEATLQSFPPQVVYIHGGTPAVPVFFRDASSKWAAGDFFGWLIVAGHGVNVTQQEFELAMQEAVPMVPDLCNETSSNLACWSGCLLCDEADDACSAAITAVPLPNIQEETNFLPIHLALVQATTKINKFQQAVQDILAKDPPAKTVVKINDIQDAIAAIDADFQVQGPQHVVIFGHGAPGLFKVGEEDLGNAANQAKFIAGVKGKIKALTLYGCEVSKGSEGQAFLKKLTEGLQAPVHTWTGKVYAFGNDPIIPAQLRNTFYIEGDTEKKEIPAVTEWGLAIMLLLVLAAGTIVIKRARTVRSQA